MQQRTAIAADVSALHTLIESAYRGASARAGWTHEADLLGGQRTDAATLTAMIADREQAILLLEDNGSIIGCIAVERHSRLAYIAMVTTSPERQGEGIGRRLLTNAEEHAVVVFGVGTARMSVIAQRAELIDWYVRRGYRKTGETAPFPYDNRRFGDPVRDDLHFVILEKMLA